jgi:hypothetical protein
MRNLTLCCLLVAAGLSQSNAQQWGQYTLYSVMNSTTVYLLDTNSAVHKTWTFPSTAKTGYSTYMLPGGTLLRTVARSGNSFTGGPICGEVQKVDWSGTVTWDFVYSTTNYCTHHDICPMPNGNVLLIAYERKTATDVTAAGGSNSIEMWPDKIVEVQPTGATTGNIVWEWHAWDHLMQSVDASKANYVSSISAHPELLNINYKQAKDWLHMNGVSYNEQLDQIVWSSHNMSEIYVIDHSTTTAEAASHAGGNSGKGGDILYRWGNPAAYGAGTTTNQVLNVTHDAHWVPQGCPKAGYLVAYNNKGVQSGTSYTSTIDMVNPPMSGSNYVLSGTAYSPASFTNRVVSTGYTSNMGGSQQLPNGNMLITIALSGNIYEIDSNSNVLWTKAAGGSVAKAFRYSACYISGTQPATPSITNTGNVLSSSATSGNQWYLNGVEITGATSQTYTATQSGTYTVLTVDANGCASNASSAFNYTATGINDLGLNKTNLFPNPTKGIINIAADAAIKNYEVIVFDAQGKLILQAPNANTIDLSSFNNGMYLISIRTEQGTVNRRITLIK